MCTFNYWDDICKSDRNDLEFEAWWAAREVRWKRKLGLPSDAPKWLVWNATTKPPGPTQQAFRQEARNKVNHHMRNFIANGGDFEDLIVEDRPSRLDGRGWWY